MTDTLDQRAEKKRCFVVTPIGGDQSDERRHANMVFELALKPNLERENFTLERADLAIEPGQITAAVFSALNEADLCIADLTFLNANVMYELGVRHALQKPVIQIAEKNTPSL
jgi:nucleoside 2-deoxyribosyltransferase